MSLGKKNLHPEAEQKLLGIIIEIRKELNLGSSIIVLYFRCLALGL